MSARVLVSGALTAVDGQGGAAWSTLHFVLGLRDLGHDVVVAEPSPPRGAARSAAVEYRAELVDQLGLSTERVLLVDLKEPETTEADTALLAAFIRGADVHVNLSGRLRAPRLLRTIPIRVYVDLDPGYTQAWLVQGEELGTDGHTHFVTIGPGIADGTSTAPATGHRWRAMLHPIFLPAWACSPPPEGPFTTVGHWRSFGTLTHAGRTYGPRAHTARRVIGLPAKVPVALRVALAIDPAEARDAANLRAHGWELVDPRAVARTPVDFRRFVRLSAGEIGLPKQGYAAWDSGWFSERSAAYMATGRPVVTLGTGFGRYLPTGRGLLSFHDEDSAAQGIRAVLEDPGGHGRAARALAEEHFDSQRLLSDLLDSVGR